MTTEQNLLFSVLALQAGLIDSTQFTQACAALLQSSDESPTELFLSRGWLQPADAQRLERELQTELARHDGDSQASLTGIVDSRVHQSLECIDDSTLMKSVAALLLPPRVENLTATQKYQRLLTKGDDDRATQVPPAPPGNRYQCKQMHARGGLGQIWLADDVILGREVALKNMRPGAENDSQLRQRFVLEAKITGQLEHPGIVPVHELSDESENNSPFYVMRFIRGKTLSEAVAEFHHKAKSSRAGLLELSPLLNAFIAICNAVAYAHSRGVIHRDLKSSNVILGDFGEVMVLDWGLAKILERQEPGVRSQVSDKQKPTDGGRWVEICQTRAGAILGTPAYMSPEQAAGKTDEIDHRADIYSLGAMLYEILTGRPPFSLAPVNAAPDEQTELNLRNLLNRVQTEPPVKPSQIASNVPVALESICLKALAKSPEERFSSALELAGDVQRWLADEAVSCHRDSLPVRLGRWTRRHKTLVTAAAVLLLTAVVGLTVSTILIGQEQARTRQMAEESKRNFQKARQAVDQFYVQVSEDLLLDEPGMQRLRKDLLNIARQYYESFARERKNDPQLQADLGITLLKLARISRKLGEGKQTLEWADGAIGILEQLHRRDPNDSRHRSYLGQAQNLRGAALSKLHRNADAEKAFLKARQLLQFFQPTVTSDAEAGKYLGNTISNLGVLRKNHADTLRDKKERLKALRAAEQLHRRSLEIHKRLSKARPLDDRLKDEIAADYTNLALAFLAMGKIDDARNQLGESLRLHEELVKRHPKSIVFQHHLAKSRDLMGAILGTTKQAKDLLKSALELQQKITVQNPEVPEFSEHLARIHRHLGNLFHRLAVTEKSHLLKAMEHYLAEKEIFGRLESRHGDSEYRLRHGAAARKLADVVYITDKAAAKKLYDLAITKLRGVKNQSDSYEWRNGLGMALWGRADIHATNRNWNKSLIDWHDALQSGRHSFTMDQFSDIRKGLIETLQKAQKAGCLQTENGKKMLRSLEVLPELQRDVEFRMLTNEIHKNLKPET